jgi:hypothetical protein
MLDELGLVGELADYWVSEGSFPIRPALRTGRVHASWRGEKPDEAYVCLVSGAGKIDVVRNTEVTLIRRGQS